MRRVDHDGRGRLDVLHHPAAGPRPHQAPDTRLHLRIAFRFLVLVLNFLPAHPELARPSASLPGVVDQAEDQQERGAIPEHFAKRGSDARGGRVNTRSRQPIEVSDVPDREMADQVGEDRKRQECLESLCRILPGQLSESGKPI